MITSADDASLALFQEIVKRRSRCFTVISDPCSLDSVDFLDVTLFKGPRWRRTGILDHKVFVKPTSHWQPLSTSSAHHPMTHRAWPFAMLRRYLDLSSSHSMAMDSTLRVSTALVSRCGGVFDWKFPAPATIHKPDVIRKRFSVPHSSAVFVGDCFVSFPVLVIPFRPEWLYSRVVASIN